MIHDADSERSHLTIDEIVSQLDRNLESHWDNASDYRERLNCISAYVRIKAMNFSSVYSDVCKTNQDLMLLYRSVLQALLQKGAISATEFDRISVTIGDQPV